MAPTDIHMSLALGFLTQFSNCSSKGEERKMSTVGEFSHVQDPGGTDDISLSSKKNETKLFITAHQS